MRTSRRTEGYSDNACYSFKRSVRVAAVDVAHPAGQTLEAGMAGAGGGEELGSGRSSGMFGLALGGMTDRTGGYALLLGAF